MKKIIIFSTVLLALVCTPSFVLAKPASPSSKTQKRLEIRQRIEEKKQLIYEKREAVKQRIEEKKASISAKVNETRRARVRFYWGRLRVRLESIVSRLEKILARIESRIAKIKSAGELIDTTEAEEQVEVAKDALNEISLAIELAEEELEVVLLSDNPKEAFKKVKDSIREIRDDLIEVHRTLVHLIGDIKGLRVGQSNVPEATSSPTITQ